MSTNFNGSICLTDIPKECITTGKNGKKYLNIYVNERQQPSQYGHTHYIKVAQPKDVTLPEGTKLFIGDLKESSFSQQSQQTQSTTQQPPAVVPMYPETAVYVEKPKQSTIDLANDLSF